MAFLSSCSSYSVLPPSLPYRQRQSPSSLSSFARIPTSPPPFPSLQIARAGLPDYSVESVVSPGLSHANLLFFKSAYNVQIMVNEDEPEEVLLRRFRREVSKAGVIQECKRRRFFENKQEEKKRKAREAGRRNRRRRLGSRFSSSSSSSSSWSATNRSDDTAKKGGIGDEAEDNWEMPQENLPL